MRINVREKKHRKIFGLSVFWLLLLFVCVPNAYAGVIGSPKDTVTREAASTAANHTITFTTPSGIDVGDTVTLTFEAGFNIASVVLADVTIGGNAPASAVVASQVLTITADADTTVVAGNTATIVIGNTHIVNPGSAGDYIITFGGTFGDTGALAIPILTNDRIAVSGSIDPSITFALSTNTCAFGTLTTGTVGTCGPCTYTVGTNGGSGYTVTVQDEGSGAAPGLYKSAIPTDLIASASATLASGTKGYGIQAGVNTGAQTIAATYLQTGTTVGGLNRTATTISSYANATTTDHITNVTARAAIAAGTYAGTYNDTLTFLATGNF